MCYDKQQKLSRFSKQAYIGNGKGRAIGTCSFFQYHEGKRLELDIQSVILLLQASENKALCMESGLPIESKVNILISGLDRIFLSFFCNNRLSVM